MCRHEAKSARASARAFAQVVGIALVSFFIRIGCETYRTLVPEGFLVHDRLAQYHPSDYRISCCSFVLFGWVTEVFLREGFDQMVNTIVVLLYVDVTLLVPLEKLNAINFMW